MKTLKSIAKLALAVVVLLSTSACYTTKLGEVHDFEGIVWRGDIVRQFKTNSDSLGKDFPRMVELMHLDQATQKFPRATMVRLQDGGFFKALRVGSCVVPDSVEYSSLENGAIVDMIFQRGDDVCVFHGNWTPKPPQTGHAVQRKLDTHSTPNWTLRA